MNQDWEQRRQERWERRHERRARRGHSPYTGLFIGLLMIGGGMLFLLRNLGIVYFDNIGQYWPVILIVIGGSKLVSPRGAHEVVTGLILGGIGTLFLLRNLGIIYGNVWGFIWPAFFIAIGLSMLVKHLYGPDWWTGGDQGFSTVSGTSENTITADVLFGGIERKITSQNFEGGRVSVIFGGAEIDLREAAIQHPMVTLQTDAVFGGVELKVPATWQVDVRGSGVFGGYEDRTHHPATLATGQAPKLIVKGSAVFGGVTVRN
jgi:predicted membrane protein